MSGDLPYVQAADFNEVQLLLRKKTLNGGEAEKLIVALMRCTPSGPLLYGTDDDCERYLPGELAKAQEEPRIQLGKGAGKRSPRTHSTTTVRRQAAEFAVKDDLKVAGGTDRLRRAVEMLNAAQEGLDRAAAMAAGKDALWPRRLRFAALNAPVKRFLAAALGDLAETHRDVTFELDADVLQRVVEPDRLVRHAVADYSIAHRSSEESNRGFGGLGHADLYQCDLVLLGTGSSEPYDVADLLDAGKPIWVSGAGRAPRDLLNSAFNRNQIGRWLDAEVVGVRDTSTRIELAKAGLGFSVVATDAVHPQTSVPMAPLVRTYNGKAKRLSLTCSLLWGSQQAEAVHEAVVTAIRSAIRAEFDGTRLVRMLEG